MARGELLNKKAAKWKKPGWQQPEYQIWPVIDNKIRTTKIGSDTFRGYTVRVKQKGIQLQRQVKKLSNEGAMTAPYEAGTIFNYETTFDNELVKSKGWTPDDVLAALKEHPAYSYNKRRAMKTFYLKQYEAEVSEEEQELVDASAEMPVVEMPREPQHQTPFGLPQEPVGIIPPSIGIPEPSQELVGE